MRGITISLDGGRLSDLYFNYEHPERDKLYVDAHKAKSEIDDAELDNADRADAMEFAAVLDIPQSWREDFVAELIADFRKRI